MKKPKLRIKCTTGAEANLVWNKLIDDGYSLDNVNPIILKSIFEPTAEIDLNIYIMRKKKIKYEFVTPPYTPTKRKIRTCTAKQFMSGEYRNIAELKIECKSAEDAFNVVDILVATGHKWQYDAAIYNDFRVSLKVSPRPTDVYIFKGKKIDWSDVGSPINSYAWCSAKTFLRPKKHPAKKEYNCDTVIYCEDSKLDTLIRDLAAMGYHSTSGGSLLHDCTAPLNNVKCKYVVCIKNDKASFAPDYMTDSVIARNKYGTVEDFYKAIGGVNEIKIRCVGGSTVAESGTKREWLRCHPHDKFNLCFGIGVALSRMFGDDSVDLIGGIDYTRTIHVGDYVERKKDTPMCRYDPCSTGVVDILRDMMAAEKDARVKDNTFIRFTFDEPTVGDTYRVAAMDEKGNCLLSSVTRYYLIHKTCLEKVV